ncbi:Thymidine_kinase [Hexamita inflata]|uniref:Thymidine kinase n=1 Tax=Hexamita inflata TaxID=28002 RepID=A0AA86N613_9EUKA|nr:Thymidine kinase [Hexamita inflata]CAI9928418.1 Thymidine kinase [Hexamita inflata]CAI9954863.1 Thymidine kinase [Hexamita inflata]
MIKLILGPMFAGKTTELLRLIRLHKQARQQVLAITYAEDDRILQTHDFESEFSVPALSLSDAQFYITEQTRVIAIDEGQFYPDLVEFCERWASEGFTVIVAALDGDTSRTPFANVSKLISLADDVYKLTAVCQFCAETAPFTIKSEEFAKFGDKGYAAVCRKCFYKFQ